MQRLFSYLEHVSDDEVRVVWHPEEGGGGSSAAEDPGGQPAAVQVGAHRAAALNAGRQTEEEKYKDGCSETPKQGKHMVCP